MQTLEGLIGNTPLVEFQHIPTKPGVKIYGKLEGNNPGGSVKDRAAYGMITGALDRGDIKPGDKLVEATSGNTGIALAMIAQLKGLKMTLLMPASATRERVLAMKAYGAQVILTPQKQKECPKKKATSCLISLAMMTTMVSTIKPLVQRYGEIRISK